MCAPASRSATSSSTDSTAGSGTPAPAAGADEPRWHARAAAPAPWPTDDLGVPTCPFAGLRIVDLGIIVAGGELSRLFGDLGAEVIKVESAAYPDGLRQGRPGQVMSESFAWTHRNNLGLGLELRSPAGADGVRPNWSRAPMRCSPISSREPLPDLAFPTRSCSGSTRGSCSPRAARSATPGRGARGMGYGPLVRASTGVTALWTVRRRLA